MYNVLSREKSAVFMWKTDPLSQKYTLYYVHSCKYTVYSFRWKFVKRCGFGMREIFLKGQKSALIIQVLMAILFCVKCAWHTEN